MTKFHFTAYSASSQIGENINTLEEQSSAVNHYFGENINTLEEQSSAVNHY